MPSPQRYHHSALALLCLFAFVVGKHAGAEERGTLLYEYWTGISGNSLSALTNDPRYPDAPSGRMPLTSFEAASNWNDAYGARLRGYLHPNQTGEYRFSIAGDDTCELWLSSTTDPLQKRLIASVPGYTAAREWSRYPQQQSATLVLTAGATYYIEARQKEGAGSDHLAVAWTGPGIGETPTVITGEYLSPSAIENPVIPPSAGTGSLTVQTWLGLSGNTLSALTGVSWYPVAPTTTGTLTSFATPSNLNDNYGQRVRGFVCPNITGTYRLWIASDDQSELLLSTDENPANAVRIASVPSYTGSLQWDRFPEQKSAEVLLTGGLRYYVEVRHKEGVGGDHLAVAWEGPSQARAVIAGANLAPWPVPIISGQAVFSESTTVSINATVTAASIVYTTDGSVPTADSLRYDAPFTVSASTVVTAAIIAADGTVGESTQGVFRKPGSGSGLAAGYYANENLVGTPIQRVDPVVNFNWGSNAPMADFPANNFSVRWQGEIETVLPEPYTLIARTDDGVRVWIDGVLVINDWTYHGARDASAVLPPGRHTLDIEYKEGTGSASTQLLWTSAHTGREIVPATQLYPLLGVRGVIPPTSPVSPVYLEVSHRMGVTPTATVAGAAAPMHHLDDVVRYLNASLTPNLPTAVEISGGDGEPLTGQITWTPTVVAGHTETIIRAGDSLLLNFPHAGNLSITTYSGTYLPTQAVTEGQLKPVRFSTGGIHIVRLTTPEGIESATLDVTVVSADLSDVVLAEVGYTRAVNVAIAPPNAPVTFLGNSQLGVVTDSIAQNLADLRITPQRRGTPRLQARILGPHGPLIGEQAIDEFTIDQTALRSAVINASTNIGTSTLVMRPFIPNQRFILSMFAHSATFAGGARALTIDTNGAPASNGEAPMAQQWDVTTSEMIGIFRFDLEVPENESKYCFRVARQQLPAHQTGAYLPTATGGAILSHVSLLTASNALLIGSHETPTPDGPTSNVNGDACHVQTYASLIFTKADDSYEDEVSTSGNAEKWISRQWDLITSDYCVKGESGDGNCNSVSYQLNVSEPPTFDGQLDSRIPALFGASDPQSGCKTCSGSCGPVYPSMDSGTIPGKYTTSIGICGSGSGDTLNSAGGGVFYVSKLDAHGVEGEQGVFRKLTTILDKRPGSLVSPVIQMEKGGDGSFSDCSLYGWIGDCADKNEWVFKVVARDENGQGENIPDGVEIKWLNLPGHEVLTTKQNDQGDQPEVIKVNLPVGRHFPRVEIWYHQENSEPRMIGNAEIHSVVVENKRGGNVGGPNPVAEDPNKSGQIVKLTNHSGGIGVDARIGISGDSEVRGRVSIDGYPQNQYWVKADDAVDLPQVVTVKDAESIDLYLQGYGKPSQTTGNLTLTVEGQALLETCAICPNPDVTDFMGTAVIAGWQVCDKERFDSVQMYFRVMKKDGETGEVAPSDWVVTSGELTPEVRFAITGADLLEGGDARVVIAGTIKDAMSELGKDESKITKKINIYVNGALADSIDVSYSSTSDPWKKREISGSYNKSLTIAGGAGLTGISIALQTESAGGDTFWGSSSWALPIYQVTEVSTSEGRPATLTARPEIGQPFEVLSPAINAVDAYKMQLIWDTSRQDYQPDVEIGSIPVGLKPAP